MNEEQIKVLEQWIACERASNKAMAAARMSNRDGAVGNAQTAFKNTCDAAVRAFSVLHSAFGLEFPAAPQPQLVECSDARR